MNRPGHVGATLLILSPFIPRLGVEIVALAAIFSMLPDVDLVLKVKHREYTHNFTFAAIMTVLFFFLFRYWDIPEMLALSVFAAVSIHIAVDACTMQKFPPLFPFSRKRVALRLFRSDNSVVNAGVFILGSIAFVYFGGGGNVWW